MDVGLHHERHCLCVEVTKRGEFNPAGKLKAGFGLTVKRQSQMLRKRDQVRDKNNYCADLRAEITSFQDGFNWKTTCAYMFKTSGRPL